MSPTSQQIEDLFHGALDHVTLADGTRFTRENLLVYIDAFRIRTGEDGTPSPASGRSSPAGSASPTALPTRPNCTPCGPRPTPSSRPRPSATPSSGRSTTGGRSNRSPTKHT